MKTANGINLTMLCDFYELTMGNGYFLSDRKDRISYFDVFFRRVPDAGGFAIAAGLEQIVSYIQNLHFDPEDIAYLRSRGIFDERFLSYLENFRFSGDIWAVPEGTPIFPGEPVITVRAPAIEAQLLETYMLLEFNHQSLIATKASRICRAAEGRTVLEFGSRRAQGIAGAVTGARAAFIGGCAGTACTVSDQIYGVPAAGTMAHSWVQMFDSEYEAFVHYCRTYPENAVLLVDTYDSLRSGVPNAIRAFDEILKPLGIKKCGIRFDSGDMAYLTKKARKMLDDAGWTECRITVSNSLDEHLIRDLIRLLRRGRATDHFEERAGLRRCLQALRCGGRRREPHSENQNLGEYRKDHEPGFQEALPLLRPGDRQGRGRLYLPAGGDGSGRSAPDDLRSDGPLEAQDHGKLPRRRASGARVPGRQAGISAPDTQRDQGLLRKAD